MPVAKLLLIDNENRGGFPSAKKPEVDADAELSNGMQAPGLVARLMGLESVPAVVHERPRKATDYGGLSNREKSGPELRRIDQDLCRTNGGLGKLESRPQKLQKTGGGFLDRQATVNGRVRPGVLGEKVAPFHSKNKHHKLASPIKSPRLLSSGHHTHLMKATTRILKPGLQSSARAKSAIIYVNSSLADAKGIDAVATLENPNKLFCDPILRFSTSHGSLGGASGLELEEKEPLRPKVGLSSLDLSIASCSHAGFKGNSLTSLDREQKRKKSLPVQAKNSMQNRVKDLTGKKHNQNTCKPKPDGSPTIPQRSHVRQNQNQSSMVRDKVAFGSKVFPRKQGRTDANELNDTEGSIPIDRNISNYNRMKSPYERSTHRRALGNNSLDKNMARKRTIGSFCVENVDTFHSSCAKQSVESDLTNQKGIRFTSNRSVNKKYIKTESKNDNGNDFSFRSNDNIISFTFNSPIRCASRSLPHKVVEDENRFKNEHISYLHSDRILVLDAKSNTLTSNQRTTLTGDELSNLLEQKIRELTSVNQDELVAGDSRSASFVLAELTACRAEVPVSGQNDHNQTGGSSKKGAMPCCMEPSDFPIPQLLGEAKFSPFTAVLATDNDQLSPISILEASFSNESCSFENLNASSGCKLQYQLSESCNTALSSDFDNDLLDSATSVDIGRSSFDKIQHSTYVSSSNLDIHCDEVGFSKIKFCEARHAVSNTVLLFENFTLFRSDGSVNKSLESFLLDMLQAILGPLCVGLKGDPSYIEAKKTDQLRVLLFDCMIECLDSKYISLCKSGYMMYFKLPFLLSRDQMMGEVHKEIQGWMDLAGKFLDDLIKNDMISSAGTWTDCKIETFEAGMEIESNILQALVDELVIEFCRCFRGY